MKGSVIMGERQKRNLVSKQLFWWEGGGGGSTIEIKTFFSSFLPGYVLIASPVPAM